MSKICGLSQRSISRFWRAFALAPHRTEPFKLSRDSFFIDKVRDIVGFYLHPPDRALVLCVDEKSQIQARDRIAPLLRPNAAPITSGMAAPARLPFATLDTKTGSVLSQLHRRHRSQEFRKFLDAVDHAVPAPLDIHLILNNYGTHKTPLILRWLVQRPRFYLHFTPTSASWVNVVEHWFTALTEKQIGRGGHCSTRELEGAIRDCIAYHNTRPKPFIWTKTADQILDSVARSCKRILDSGNYL